MPKQKILISKNLPADCLTPFESQFDFTMPPEADAAYDYNTVLHMIPDYVGCFAVDLIADKAFFDAAKNLKAIANFGVGYDRIDWQYATERGIPVLNTPTQVTESTAELTVALMMAVMRSIPHYDREVRQKIWNSPLFSQQNTQLYGSTLGILGLGRIGKAVCRKARGLGMHVIYYDVFRCDEVVEKELDATYMSFDDVLAQSDCVTLHMPYSSETHHLFGADTFAKMKPDAYFINAGRGKLVDEKALCQALANNVIKGAGLDVYEEEPIVSEALLTMDNVVLTPHIASLTMRSRIGMAREGLEGLTAVLLGQQPTNVVNPSVFDAK